MIEGVRLWLLSILTVSLVCALADAMMPAGAVKKVGRLVCGLVLAAVVLTPVVTLDLEEGRQWLESYGMEMDEQEEKLKKQVSEEMKIIIQQDYEAYIVDKAAHLGAECTAKVECSEEDGVCLPERAWISGTLSPEVREELTRILQEELGLSPEALSYTDGEETP